MILSRAYLNYISRSFKNWFPVALFMLVCIPAIGQKKMPIILDADTGNEVDDLFAIARVLIEPTWEVLALNATHWQTSHWAVPESMENSHRLNQLLVGQLGLSIKTNRGGVARMYDWGDKAQHSAAAYEIIKQAKNMPSGEKLTVIALGALTNVASAIYIDPGIESRIRLYWLGTSFDFEREVLTRTDFNCMMDIQALETLLQSEVEMTVIPVNVAADMQFDYKTTQSQLSGIHTLGDVLVDRWYNHLDGSRNKRTIWDLALIEAMIHPEWAESVTVTTSKDSGNKEITFYKSIQADKMKAEFFEKIIQYVQDQNRR